MTQNSINWVLERHANEDYINEVFVGVVIEATEKQSQAGKDMTFCKVRDLRGESTVKWTLFDSKRGDLKGKEIEFIPIKGKGNWIKRGEYQGEPQINLGPNAMWKEVFGAGGGSGQDSPENPPQSSGEFTPSHETNPAPEPPQRNPRVSQSLSVEMEGMVRGNLYISAMKSAIYVRRKMEDMHVTMTPEQFQACVSTLFISLAQNFLPGKGFNDRKAGETGVDNCLPEQFIHQWKWSDKEKEFFHKQASKQASKQQEEPPHENTQPPQPPTSSGDDEEELPF